MNESLSMIEFHGDSIEAVRKDDEIWVSVRRVCEALGVSMQGQHEKLLRAKWARIKEMIIRDTTGHNQAAFMLNIKSLPMWLASIKPGKVSPEVRPKLECYQAECADVLYRHFLDKRNAALPSPVELVKMQHELRKELYALWGIEASPQAMVNRVEQDIADMAGKVAELPSRSLDVTRYLGEQGLTAAEIKESCGNFGKHAKRIYSQVYGQDPPTKPRELSGGIVRPVSYYTEEHRATVLDRAFEAMFGRPAIRATLPANQDAEVIEFRKLN